MRLRLVRQPSDGMPQKLFLRTDLGFRAAEEYRFQCFPVSERVVPSDYYLKAPRARRVA